MSYYLGIDIGTSGTKTILVDASGKILGEASEGYPLYHPKPLWSEQDPEDWWQATVKTVRAAVKRAKVKPAEVVKSGILSTSIGTSGVMFVHSDEVEIDPQGRLHTFCHAVRGKWHMMGVSLTAGGALQWFAEQLCAELARGKTDPYEVLTREAAAVAAGSEGLFFLPYLAGERTPHADPDARGCFVGLTLKHTRGHLARAIMEGVTYAMRDSLAIIEEMGVPVRQVRASGGGAKSALWRQLQADLFGKKVVTLKAEQGPAFGVALLAAVGAGEYKNIEEACAATIELASETAVDRKAKRIYDAGFPVYQGLYQSLQGDFKRISSLG